MKTYNLFRGDDLHLAIVRRTRTAVDSGEQPLERHEILKLHRNAQRLLRPLLVVNEHVKQHTFPDYVVRTRRDHMKFLTLVQAIALLYQHQREIKRDTRKGKTLEYIEATPEDVALACDVLP